MEMNDLLNDFVNEDEVEFNIEGKVFKYKPVTAGDENDWLDEYIERTPEGKTKQNLSKLNECKLRNITKVPYTKEIFKQLIGVDKEWFEMSKEERLSVFKKLKPSIFSELITKMNQTDKGTVGDTKNQ